MKTTLALIVAASAALAACGQRHDERADAGVGNSTRAVPAEKNAAAGADNTSAMGASGAPKSPLADKSDDGKITGMVMSGLKADKELNPLRIDVDTQSGVVTLSGSVPTAAAKARAAEVAKNVKDVKSVNNQLTISSS